MKKSKSQILAKRRYYLHKMVKKTFDLSSRDRSVFVSESLLELAKANKYIKELISEFGYNIQITLAMS